MTVINVTAVPATVLCHPHLPLGQHPQHTHCLAPFPALSRAGQERAASQSPTFQESPLVAAAALGDLCAWNQPGRSGSGEQTAGLDRLLDHPHQMQRCRTLGPLLPGPDPRSVRTQSPERLPEAPWTGPLGSLGSRSRVLPESPRELAF